MNRKVPKKQIITEDLDISTADKSPRKVIDAAKKIIDLEAKAKTILTKGTKQFLLDHESSMNRMLVAAANNNYLSIVKPMYLPQVEKVESVILTLKDEFIQAWQRSLTPGLDDLQKIFLQKHQVAMLAQDYNVLNLARKMFTSNENIFQVAWRNFDPYAPIFSHRNIYSDELESSHRFDNLLLEPIEADKEVSAYSVRESGLNHNNLYEARRELRERLAIYYLAIKDEKQGTQEDRQRWFSELVAQLADMRRAHNGEDAHPENTLDIDEPTCYPGGIGRLGLVGIGHPVLHVRIDSEKFVPDIMQSLVSRVFKRELEECTTEEEVVHLYESLVMMSSYNAQDFIDGKSGINDFDECMWRTRNKFITNFQLKKVCHKINDQLRIRKVPTINAKTLNVLIKYYLADVGGGWICGRLNSIFLSIKESKESKESKDVDSLRKAQISTNATPILPIQRRSISISAEESISITRDRRQSLVI